MTVLAALSFNENTNFLNRQMLQYYISFSGQVK